MDQERTIQYGLGGVILRMGCILLNALILLLAVAFCGVSRPDGSNTNGLVAMALIAMIVAALSAMELVIAGFAVRGRRLGGRWLVFPAVTLSLALVAICGSYIAEANRTAMTLPV